MSDQEIINKLHNKMTCSVIISLFKKTRCPKHIKTVKQFRRLILPAYVNKYGHMYQKPQHLINEIKKLNKRLPKIFFFLAKHYDAFSKSGYGLTFRNNLGKKHFEGLAGGFPRANRLIKLMKAIGIIRLRVNYKAKIHSNIYVSGYYHVKGKLWTSPSKLYFAQLEHAKASYKWGRDIYDQNPSNEMVDKINPFLSTCGWACNDYEKQDEVKRQDQLLVRRANYHKIKKFKGQTESLHFSYEKDKPLYRAGFYLSNGKEKVFIYDTSVSIYGAPMKLSDERIRPDLISIITQCGIEAKAGKLDNCITSSYYYQTYVRKYMDDRDPILASDDDYMENGKLVSEVKEEERRNTWNEFFADEIKKQEEETKRRLDTWYEFFADEIKKQEEETKRRLETWDEFFADEEEDRKLKQRMDAWDEFFND